MGKYINDAKELLHLVGGRENIAAVSHCITRMRFVLNDPKKADIQKIEAMKVVKGSFTQAGQFQVIIGNTVSDFYNDFTAVAGIEGVSKDAVKSAAKQNQNVVQRIMTALAEIFAPLIPAIIVGGLILGFRNCIDIVGWGMKLSGGQKQRLCIARAILKQPKVLILDDSTSAVDTATEAKIREGLKAKLPEMTKIIIAQRISSVRSADQIVILDDGKINAVGTHEQLLAENRIYQEIYHSQQEGGAL